MDKKKIIKEINKQLFSNSEEQLNCILKLAKNKSSIALPKETEGTDQIEEKDIVVTFQNYKQNHCQLGQLNNNLAKKLTDNLKKLTNTKSSKVRAELDIRSVRKDNEYKRLYDGLSNQIDLEEIIYDSTGRVFGYFGQNYFSIIAITTVRHLNT